jgi:hypothetical protein
MDSDKVRRAALEWFASVNEDTIKPNDEIVVCAVNPEPNYASVFIVDLGSFRLTSITYMLPGETNAGIPTPVKESAMAFKCAIEAELENLSGNPAPVVIAISHDAPVVWTGNNKRTAVPALADSVMPLLAGKPRQGELPVDAPAKPKSVFDVLVYTVVIGVKCNIEGQDNMGS